MYTIRSIVVLYTNRLLFSLLLPLIKRLIRVFFFFFVISVSTCTVANFQLAEGKMLKVRSGAHISGSSNEGCETTWTPRDNFPSARHDAAVVRDAADDAAVSGFFVMYFLLQHI